MVLWLLIKHKNYNKKERERDRENKTAKCMDCEEKRRAVGKSEQRQKEIASKLTSSNGYLCGV